MTKINLICLRDSTLKLLSYNCYKGSVKKQYYIIFNSKTLKLYRGEKYINLLQLKIS